MGHVTNGLSRARKIAGLVRRRIKARIRSILYEGPLRPGLCNICGSTRGFVCSPKHEPRENFFCKSCRSTSRDRLLIYTLGLCLGQNGPLRGWHERRDTRLLETSGYRAHPYWLKQKFTYLNLIYDGVTDGAFILGDISKLCVGDGSVDAIISSDVFEHVRDDVAGFAEISRVLRPGGYFLLQVPKLGEAQDTEVRVRVEGNNDIYVMPLEYHAEASLVYRYYGNDLADRLPSFGLSARLLTAAVSAYAIPEQTVLIAQKASVDHTGLTPVGTRSGVRSDPRC